MSSKPLAVLAVTLLLVAAVGPAAAASSDLSVALDQDDAGDANVTDSDTETLEGNETDGNSTDEANASDAADDAFGQQVSAFVHSLLNGTEEQQRIGRLIASWVVQNNPGNAPEHAGPPDDRGPSSSAGFDAGGNETDGNATSSSGPGNGDGNGNGNGNGPPENPGNGNDEARGNGK